MDTPAAPARTPLASEMAAHVSRLRTCFNSGRTRPLSWRRAQLEAVDRMLTERSAELLAALAADLGKPDLEAYSHEVVFCQNEAKLALKKLASWAKPERVPTSLVAQPGRSVLMPEPLGVVFIISPWNFPLQLMIAPLVGAIAAGNCALLKPSELSVHTSKLLAEIIPKYLDNEAFVVVEGGVAETAALLEQRFDHIFFTGSPRVGRIVMAAAAKHLTPVTLELGGKCPCIVDHDANLDVAARRIVWAKFVNAGQVCLAPDHLLVHEQVYDRLIERLVATVREFFGDDPKASPDYGRIINAEHVRRLAKLLDGENVAIGGDVDEQARYIAPTIIRDVGEDSALMEDELFGPLLPVLRVANVDAAIASVNSRSKPLALYVFSENKRTVESVLARTSSGGAIVNHLLMHVSVPALPFGGVGESGMGGYHGRASFDTFSHRKSVLYKGTGIDPSLMYPPYTEDKKKWIKRLM